VTLVDDLDGVEGKPAGGFDAVICLGNSFAHMPDFEGDQQNQKRALTNFMDLLKPGGVLLIDHRNYDEILATGLVPAKNIYYNVRTYSFFHVSRSKVHIFLFFFDNTIVYNIFIISDLRFKVHAHD